MFGKAIQAMGKALETPQTNFPVGQEVIIINDEYDGTSAEVIGHCTNLFDIPLVDVRTADGSELCFYSHELKLDKLIDEINDIIDNMTTYVF